MDPRHDTPEFKRIKDVRHMANTLDNIGGRLSGLGEYGLANKVWAVAASLRDKAISDTQNLYKAIAAGKIDREN